MLGGERLTEAIRKSKNAGIAATPRDVWEGETGAREFVEAWRDRRTGKFDVDTNSSSRKMEE